VRAELGLGLCDRALRTTREVIKQNGNLAQARTHAPMHPCTGPDADARTALTLTPSDPDPDPDPDTATLAARVLWRYAQAYTLRGLALAFNMSSLSSGVSEDVGQGVKHIREALRLDPDDAEAQRSLKKVRQKPPPPRLASHASMCTLRSMTVHGGCCMHDRSAPLCIRLLTTTSLPPPPPFLFWWQVRRLETQLEAAKTAVHTREFAAAVDAFTEVRLLHFRCPRPAFQVVSPPLPLPGVLMVVCPLAPFPSRCRRSRRPARRSTRRSRRRCTPSARRRGCGSTTTTPASRCFCPSLSPPLLALHRALA